MNPETIFKALDPVQADGLACVVCGADFLRVPVPHLPVGRSVTRQPRFIAMINSSAVWYWGCTRR